MKRRSKATTVKKSVLLRKGKIDMRHTRSRSGCMPHCLRKNQNLEPEPGTRTWNLWWFQVPSNGGGVMWPS